MMSNPAPKRLAKKQPKSGGKGPVIAVVVVAAVFALLIGGYFGLCNWVRGNGLLMPGTVVSGLPGGQTTDLSKLDAESAARLLDSYLAADLSDRSLTVTFGDGRSARLEGDLLTADPMVPITSALEYKTSQPFYQLGLMWFGLGSGSQHTASALTLTEEGTARVERLSAQIAQELYVAPVDFTYELTETTVELTLGTDGQEVDREALRQSITEALLSGEETLEVTPTVVPSAELTGEILSELVYLAPQSSSMGADGKLTPTVIGHSVDAAEAQAILNETESGQSCSIPLIFLQPDLGSSESLLYQDLLYTSKTYMAGTSNRRTNIKLAAAAVDGTVVLPGATFSYNQTVGERTAAKGYKEATVYVAGQDKQELGGGICQLASALYNCALYSNLEIVSRRAHQFAVTYVPYGLDATVAWGSTDFKFKNNTDYPIRISTSTDSSYNLIVSFYGTKADDSYVKMETVRLSSTPYNTVYQIDESLAAGQTKNLVHAYTGYKYESYRCVYDGSGNLISRTKEATSTYAYRDEVIGVSPADAAKYGLGGGTVTPPEPAPSPSVEPSAPVTSTKPDSEVPPETAPGSDPTPSSSNGIPLD